MKTAESNTLELAFPLSSMPVCPEHTLKAEFLKRAACEGAVFMREERRPKAVHGPRSAAGLENVTTGTRTTAAEESATVRGQATRQVIGPPVD